MYDIGTEIIIFHCFATNMLNSFCKSINFSEIESSRRDLAFYNIKTRFSAFFKNWQPWLHSYIYICYNIYIYIYTYIHNYIIYYVLYKTIAANPRRSSFQKYFKSCFDSRFRIYVQFCEDSPKNRWFSFILRQVTAETSFA